MVADITAVAPWFGSKRILAPRIVEQLGEHRAYWEPFCGSMAVLLAKPKVSQETVNDLHGDLVNLARVIQHPTHGPWLYRQLRRTMAHESLYDEFSGHIKARGSLVESEVLDPERAYWFFVASWLGRNGVIGTKENNLNFCVRYTQNGGIQGTRFVSAVRSIPAWRRRLREVTILRRDAFELLARIDDATETSIYCDPPYLRKGATYIHDFKPEDHTRLAEALGRFRKARVVVSYYDESELEQLYPGWAKVSCPVAKGLSLQGKRGSVKQTAPEVLLVNGKPFGGEASLFDTPVPEIP